MGEVKLIHATDAKPGRYVVFDGKACIVKSLDISRPGKHGHAKCRIEAMSITDGKKIVKIMPGHDNLKSPIIGKKQAQVLSISPGKANVMDMESYETYDIEIPEEFKDQIKEGVTLMVWEVLEDKIIKEVKEGQ